MKLNELPNHLVRAYVVANTPGYFYRAAKSDPFVRQMRIQLGSNRLAQIARGEPAHVRSLEEQIYAYCALLALFASEESVAVKTSVAEACKLPWAFRLLALATSTAPATPQFIQASLPAVNFGDEVAQSSSVSFSAFNFR